MMIRYLGANPLFLSLFLGVEGDLGHTQKCSGCGFLALCSGITPVGAWGHMGCWGSISGRLCARQASNPLYYHSGPPPLSFLISYFYCGVMVYSSINIIGAMLLYHPQPQCHKLNLFSCSSLEFSRDSDFCISLTLRTICTPWGRLEQLKSKKMLGLGKQKPRGMLESG